MGKWDALARAGPDLARWAGRMWIGGPKSVRIVADRLATAYAAPSSHGGQALIQVYARFHVTNVSPHRSVRFVRVEMRKDHHDGVVAPYRPMGAAGRGLWTAFQHTGDIEPGKTEQVECTFWFPLERSEHGGFVAEPWKLRSKIVLFDNYTRKHRTKKLTWSR